MLAEVDAGQVDVGGRANDRLYRRTVDQLALMEAVSIAGGVIVTVKDGEVEPVRRRGAHADGDPRQRRRVRVGTQGGARRREPRSNAPRRGARTAGLRYGWTLSTRPGNGRSSTIEAATGTRGRAIACSMVRVAGRSCSGLERARTSRAPASAREVGPPSASKGAAPVPPTPALRIHRGEVVARRRGRRYRPRDLGSGDVDG